MSYLDEQPQVDVLGLWLGAAHLAVLVVADVDSLGKDRGPLEAMMQSQVDSVANCQEIDRFSQGLAKISFYSP